MVGVIIDGATAMNVNYDPSDPDKMRLPQGTTCGDCRHIRRCKAMFGHTETDSYCDWSPSRFALLSPQERSHD
jgi:hypothetical protein